MIINGASEHYGDGLLDQLAKQLTDDSIVYSHDPMDHNKLPNMKHYPLWYHFGLDTFVKNYNDNLAKDEKKWTLSCLNNNPRTHRVIFYMTSKKADNQLWSIHNADVHRADDMEIPDNLLKYWNQLKETLAPRETEGVNNMRIESDNIHEAYTDSYVNIISETVMLEKVFLTEKVWKPISQGQMFMILGCPGSISHLRSLGLDCFDDYINHEYDSIIDPMERIKCLQNSINQLVEQDLHDINIKTKARRRKNAELFWSGKLYKYLDSK